MLLGRKHNARTIYAVPTTSRIGGAAGDWAYGLAGGLAYTILGRVSDRYIGSPLVGGAIAGIGAGSMIKGTSGEIIATVAGFNSAFSPEISGFVDNALGSVGF